MPHHSPPQKLRNLGWHSYCTRATRESQVSLLASPRRICSHPTTLLIESVTIDNRLDVSTRCGEIDLLKKLAFRYLGNAFAAAPTLSAAGTGVVLRQSKRCWVGLMAPAFHGTMQIPAARLEICLGIEKLIRIETGDLI